LFLLWAAVTAFAVAILVIGNALPDNLALAHWPISPVEASFSLVLVLVLGYAGLAMMLRWRRWRVWAGTVSWGLIVIIVLSLFAPPSDTDRPFERLISLVVLAVAVFALIAKRRERRPDIAAVFDD
jgi:hypothetical protein